MGMSDLIADFIGGLIQESDGLAEVQRADLASRFGCVPSQITYVIATRFSPERGYVVESRRGGGGYIRIRRVQADGHTLTMHTLKAIGEVLDPRTAEAFLQNLLDAGAVSEERARTMAAALGDTALRPAPQLMRGALRASILKQMLLAAAE
ncbi:MAG: CtsR family transcriptional regulator [Oscillospiraceae bacterium]|nr:CtsR family transcriptional regulator [Oscillospiraceae bacterium]